MNSKLNELYTADLMDNQDYRRFMHIGSLIGSIFLMLFAFIDYFVLSLPLDSSLEAIGSIILFIIHRLEEKKTIKPWLVIAAVLMVALIIMVGIFANHSSDGVVIWLTIFPFMCFLLLGEKLGIIFSAFLSVLFISTLTYFYVFLPEKGFNLFGILTSAGSLICATTMAWFYEQNRRKLILLLAQQARTDALTSLLNRRGLMSSFTLFIAQYKRSKQSLCVLILDLDNFKLVNDTYGHDVGDEVIIACAKALKSELRETDTIARLGGEEYIALLPNTSLVEAEIFASRIKNSIQSLAIGLPHNKHVKVTGSIGITCTTENKVSFESLYKAADEALYTAKSNGRNCIVLN